MSSFLQVLSSPLVESLSWVIIVGFAVFGGWLLIQLRGMLNVYRQFVEKLPSLDTHAQMLEAASGTYLEAFGKTYTSDGAKRPNRDLFIMELDHDLSQQDGMIRFIIGGFTILGLILTFIGMLGTLSHATGIIEGLSRATEIKSAFETLIRELGTVMNGMISAFGRTVAALVLSLVMGLLFNQLQKSRAGLFKELVAYYDNVLRTWYFSTDSDSVSVPEKLGQLEAVLVKELRGVGRRVGTLVDSFSGVRESLDGVSSTTQASSSTLVSALSSRSAEESQFQQQYLAAANRMGTTLEGLTKVIADHAALSNELGTLIATLNPQKRQLAPFEDLKTLFAGVHAMVERLAASHESGTAQQQQAQQMSAEQIGEQTRYLSHVVQRLDAPSRIEPTLTDLRDAMERQRQLLQSIGHQLAQQNRTRTHVDSLEDIHGMEPLLREQARLLTQMLEQAERPWWTRMGVGSKSRRASTPVSARSFSRADSRESGAVPMMPGDFEATTDRPSGH